MNLHGKRITFGDKSSGGIWIFSFLAFSSISRYPIWVTVQISRLAMEFGGVFLFFSFLVPFCAGDGIETDRGLAPCLDLDIGSFVHAGMKDPFLLDRKVMLFFLWSRTGMIGLEGVDGMVRMGE